MSSVRAGQPGATRLCPHCKATVLESATICPGCRHHLRFNGGKELAAEAYTSFSVDGSIAHRQRDEACEYCIVLQITNERGEQILRQIVGVGALQPGEQRRLNVTVDMLPLVAAAASRPTAPVSPAAASATSREAPRPALAPRGGVPGSTPATRPAAAATPGATPAPAATAPAATARAATAPAGTAPAGTVPGAAAPGAAATAGAASAASSASVSAGRNLPSGARTPAAGPRAAVGPVAKTPATMPEKPSPGVVPTPSAPLSREAATHSSSSPPAPGAGPGATLGQRLRIFRKP